jgi:uncharacterized membrane protein
MSERGATDGGQRGTVDASLHEGLGINGFLTIGAGLGAAGWLGTALVDRRPAIALETLGIDALEAVVGLWLLLTVAMLAIGVTAASRAVRLSPPLWLWSMLVGAALAIDVAAVQGAVPLEYLQYALWHPWLGVFAIGYGVTAVVATGRNRRAYALGSVAAAGCLLVAVLFTVRIEPYAFVVLGALHVGPLLADAATAPAVTGHSGAEGVEP